MDCTLLLLAQSGVYIYSMFSIMGCWFTLESSEYSKIGLLSETLSLLQTSVQTIFILNAWWRRTKGSQQNRTKPGREIITFLLVANMAIWFINTLIKNRASFRQSHLDFFGLWAWTIVSQIKLNKLGEFAESFYLQITHTSMPLAIFYRFEANFVYFLVDSTIFLLNFRFHSTICLFEIWKTSYKNKIEGNSNSSD